MAKYNVTKVTREGFIHHMAFDQVIDSLSWSLAALGHDVSVTQNWFSESGETNIIFGAELIESARIPRNSVLYNLEQPSHPNMAKVRHLAKESGCVVWDYSQRSVAEWRAAGFENVHHVPIGYTPNLTRIPRATTLDIDVAFFGWMTPRRTTIIDALRKAGLNVYASAACYGGARDQILSHTKVSLNVHHDGRDRFEIVRVSYLMANAMCIVTEPSADDDEYQDLRGLNIAPARVLVDWCAAHCTSNQNEHDRELAMESIRKRNYTDSVALTLDSASFTLTPAAALTPPPSPPAPSRPITFTQERVSDRTEFLSKARALRPTDEEEIERDRIVRVAKNATLGTVPNIAMYQEAVDAAAKMRARRSIDPHPRDPRVATRYQMACSVGDMKDFAPWLRDHAKGNIVEIGVRDGASTSCFLSGIEEHGGHLWSIDIQPCGSLFAGHPQWSFLQADSKDMQTVIRFIPFEIDVLLIDGDHSRAGVISDIEYARQLRPGGIVLFHDIAPEDLPSGCSDVSWPGDDVRNVYFSLCETMAPLGWTHEEPPGRYGLGVLRKPAAVPAKLPEMVEAK